MVKDDHEFLFRNNSKRNNCARKSKFFKRLRCKIRRWAAKNSFCLQLQLMLRDKNAVSHLFSDLSRSKQKLLAYGKYNCGFGVRKVTYAHWHFIKYANGNKLFCCKTMRWDDLGIRAVFSPRTPTFSFLLPNASPPLLIPL